MRRGLPDTDPIKDKEPFWVNCSSCGHEWVLYGLWVLWTGT
jgi:hypothetical protein